MSVYRSNHQPHLMYLKTFNSPHEKGTCTLISKTVWLQKPNILIEETLGGGTTLLIECSTPSSNSSYTSVLKSHSGTWEDDIEL